MEKCSLCQNRPANKTGSHIVPLFLVQTMINQDGQKGRNKQLSIELGTLSTGVFIGREVSLEKINKVLGREMTDQERETQSDPFVLDNIFCTICETRFSHIESLYSKLSSSWTNLHDDISLSKCNSRIALLFWASVIWRVSASKIAGFSLKNEEDKLRVILDETLTEGAGELEKKISESKILDSIGYCLAFSPEHKDPTSKLFMAHPQLNYPSCIIINQHVLLFNPKGKFTELPPNAFFGFEKFNRQETFNPQNKKEIISIVNADEFMDFTRNIFKFKAKLFQEKIQQHCHYIFLNIFRMPMPPQLLHVIMNRIIHEDDELTSPNRYAIERMSRIIGEEIIKLQNPKK